MESKQIEYWWYWKTNPDPFDKSQDAYWTPYDIAANGFIEANYQKGANRFEVDIGEDTFIIDLNTNFEYLKIDNFQQRSIIRALSDEDININRQNRFTNLISGTSANNNLTEFKKYENLNRKMKLMKILGYELDEKSEFYELFNQEILISSKICEVLEIEKNPSSTKFDKDAEIVSYIAEEITKQAERFCKLDKNKNGINTLDLIKNITYIKQAEIYNEKLKNLEMPLCEKLIYIYTLEGFLVYSLNSILREGSVVHCNLPLYFMLLQASIAIASTKFNPLISKKALQTIDGKKFYKLYRGSIISEKIKSADMQSLNKKASGRFIVYNDFLSTT